MGGNGQKCLSSKAVAIFERGAYPQYMSASGAKRQICEPEGQAKWRECRCRLLRFYSGQVFSTFPFFKRHWWIMILCLNGCMLDGGNPIPDWNGLHESALVELMGFPTERVPLSGGKTQLIYDQGRLDQHEGSHTSWTCRMYFQTNNQGFIENVSSVGC